MRTIRVFVSSPGDADNERKRVVRVIERLNAAFAGSVVIEPVRWEERFYSAHEGFQPQIARSADCDIVVAILRGRLGTPLHPDFVESLPAEERLPDYPSGTAYEILSAIAARRRGAKLPDIFVFRYPLAPSVALDAPDRAEIEEQWEKLKSFAEQVFVTADGHFKGAYQTFTTTDDFEVKVEGALRQWLEENVLAGRAFVWPIAIKGSPFRGLEPFGAKHAEVFFGRDGDRARAIDRLKNAAEVGFPFLLIVGPSGAGKSSFARAGILPWLVKPGAVMGVGVWRTALMRPLDHPDGAIASLARHLFDAANDIPEPETGRPIALPELALSDSSTPQALAGLFSVFARGKFERPDDLENAGRASVAPIEKALRSVAELERKAFGGEKEQPARLLLIVDQFDELFSAGVDEAARAAFARLLDRLARTGLVWIVATMRAELYEAFLKSPLANLTSFDREGIQRLELTFDLLPPGLTEMAEVIRGPARAAGLEWETDPISKEGLDERLLMDIDRPDLLPLVQFVLDRLYEQRVIVDERITLTFEAYRALGKLDGAIDFAAEKALSVLGPAERAALPRLLRALVTSGGGKGAAALRQTPRAVAAHDVASTRLVEALIEARILVSGQDQSKAATIALAHQRVVDAWQGAQKIVAESERFLRVRDEVEDARRRWEDSGQRRDRLIPAGLPLSEAEDAAAKLQDELLPTTRAYVAKSGRAARLRQRLTATAAIVFLAVAAVAGFFWHQADRATHEAVQAADEAKRQTTLATRAEEVVRSQRDQAITQESLLLADKAREQLKLGKATTAALTALRGLSQKDERSLVAETFGALIEALGAPREARILRHDGVVDSAVFSRDGHRVLTAARDNTARVWDGATGKQIAILRGHQDHIYSAVFSPDGARALTASADGTARIWDAATGNEIATLHGGADPPETKDLEQFGESPVTSAKFSPDGTYVLTISLATRLWNAATGKNIAILRAQYLTSAGYADFSPDGKRVVTAKGGNDHGIHIETNNVAHIWDVPTGKEIVTLTGHMDKVNSAVFSPDGMRVVTASDDNTARIWNAATGKIIAVLTGHDKRVNSAVFSPDGMRVVTASDDKTARLWDATTGKEISVLRGHEGEVTTATFSPDGEYVIAAGKDIAVRLWEIASGREIAVFKGHDNLVNTAAFSPDGKQILSASADKTARLWNVASAKRNILLQGHDDTLNSIEFSPDGAQALTGSSDGTARLWNSKTGAQVAILRGHSDTVASVAFSPDGKKVLAASFDGSARVWDATTRKLISFLLVHATDPDEPPPIITKAVFSPDGMRILTASSDGIARLWDTTTAQEIGVRAGQTGHKAEGILFSAAFSPDGKQLLTASADKTARIWDAVTGKEILVLRGHDEPVSSAVFSPDGARVLTASKDKTARIWDTVTGKLITVLSGHEDTVNSAVFGPDGTRILTASDDKSVRLWEAATGKEVAIIRGFEGGVSAAVFSPDGTRILAAANDGLIHPIKYTEVSLPGIDSRTRVFSAYPNNFGRILWVGGTVDAVIENARKTLPGELSPYEQQPLDLSQVSDGPISEDDRDVNPANETAEADTMGAKDHDAAVLAQRPEMPAVPSANQVRPPPATDCDRLAASVVDVNRPTGVAGVAFDKIDTERAIQACQAAMEIYPEEPRMKFQLARALQAGMQYDRALTLYREAADAGYGLAMNNLGSMYENGQAGAKDDAKAAKLYGDAAAAGIALAIRNLGVMYENGRGVTKNIAEAVQLYRRAADAGESEAIYNLGRMYENGSGIARAESDQPVS